MKYYPIGRGGRIGVEIKLESNVAIEFREEEENKLKLEIIAEPSAIDNFSVANLLKWSGHGRNLKQEPDELINVDEQLPSIKISSLF